MEVMAVGSGHKRGKEKTCNDIGRSRVRGYVVDVFLCTQGIACRWYGSKASHVQASAE